MNTGLTVDKVKFITAREYTRRRDEIHFRLSRNQLYELYEEYEADEHESISESDTGGGGRGGGPKIVTHTEMARPVYAKPYLILDVREAEAYQRGHLLQARSFPYTLLRRDQLHPEVYQFRNKEETLIVVYCDDERISRDTAKILVDRGTENIFLLTGGFEEFAAEYPAFVEGEVPEGPR